MSTTKPQQSSTPASSWHVYMVRCRDNSFYTGITTDLTRRVEEHNSPTKGARYTRSRRPVVLVYSEKVSTRSAAARRELQIKKLPHGGKRELLQGSQEYTKDRRQTGGEDAGRV